MFEKALIRRAGDREIDIGLVAETILFYSQTQLLLSRGVISELTKMPREDLLALASHGCLQLSYVKPTFGVISSGEVRVHNFGAFEVGPRDKTRKVTTFQEEISDAFVSAYGNSSATRSAAKKFTDRVKLFKHPDFNSKKNIVCDLARADINDKRFVRAAAAATLKHIAPAYPLPPGFYLEIFDTGSGYAVNTDLNFVEISKVCIAPFTNDFTAAHLLSNLLEARADTFFAAHYMAELITNETSSDIIKLKHYEFLRRGEYSRSDISEFSEVVTNRMPSIREAIMSGSRSISDFLKLLDRAEKFKSWLQSTNPDQGLLNAYLSEVTKESWADKLPGKGIRIAVLTALGLAAEAVAPTGIAVGASLALSAGDAVLLERIAKGWRPTHFMSGPYRRFVDSNVR